MSQFDRYDNPEIEKECDWEVFIDKENPNIVNVRFGRFKEITIPPKYQWEEGQYIRFLDIDSEKIQECDFSVNGVLEATIHYVRDGLVEIPNAIFSHHGNAQCFVKHVGEDNITVVKAISFIVNRREKPPEYVAPDDEQTFRQWVQEQLDKGLIADITEIPSEEDDGLNIINITMRDGYVYVFTIKNGSKGDPGPGLAEGGTVGQIIIKKSEEDYDTEWVDNPVPSYAVEDAGKILKVANDGESVGWADAPEELPSIETGDAGKVLAVNQTEDGTEWVTVQSGTDLPVIVTGDAGKVLTVNQSEDGMEWDDVPKELPNVDVSDDGKILQVVNGEWNKVVQNENGNKTWFGSGAPSSGIASERGDYYVDTSNNNKLYICTQYIDPTNITELTNLDVVMNSTGSYPESGIENCSYGSESYSTIGNIQTKSSGNSPVRIEISDNQIRAYFKQFSGGTYNDLLIDGSGETKTGLTIGSNIAQRPIHFMFNAGASAITNQALVKWIVDNAYTITGTGSIWIEASANPLGLPSANGQTDGKILKVNNNAWTVGTETQELPTVSTGDAGKVLTVNSSENGVEWQEISVEGGVAYFSGNGAPTASIVCSVGDIYRDTSTNRLYQCSNYAPTTSLAGHTISWNNTPDFSDLPIGDHIYDLAFTYDSNSRTKINIGGSNRKVLQYGTSSSDLSYVYSYTGGGWYVESAKVIEVTGGTDATNADLIAFVEKNAKISGAGSTWVEIVAIPDGIPTVSSSDEGKVLTVNGSGEWTVSEIANTGVSYYEGSTDPVSSIDCKKGDLYRNTTSGDMYVCIQYTPLNSLAGTTVLFNSSISVSELGSFSVNFTSNSKSYNEFLGVSGSMLVYRLNGSGAIVYQNGWADNEYRTVNFIDGTDITNSSLINWVSSNATISGIGSTWAKVMPDELPSTTSADEGKLLQVNSSGNWSTSNAFEEETWTFTLTDNTQITRTVLIKVVE